MRQELVSDKIQIKFASDYWMRFLKYLSLKNPCLAGVVNDKDLWFDQRINRTDLQEQHNYREHLQLLFQALYHLRWNLLTL